MTFKRVLTQSGLTKIELGELYGVSRQTIHAWARGEPPREGSYTARMAESISKALCNAMDKGLLPMAPMPKEARAARITRMKATLQKLSPAPAR